MEKWLHNFGFCGVDPHDDHRATKAWIWMHWLLFAISLLTIPAFYLELVGGPTVFHRAGQLLYLSVALGFAILYTWLVRLSRHPRKILNRNWLDLLILFGAAASIAGGGTPWSVWEWPLRMGFMCVVAVRIVLALRMLFVPNRLLLLLLIGAAVLGVAGAGFYWLEPRVQSYADGLWLAFESSATVGYGDVAPTTPASRVFAVFVVLLGYGMLSLVFANIAAMFIGQEEKLLRREMHRDIKRLEGEIRGMREDLQALRRELAPGQSSCQASSAPRG
jgi:voltage-gated potassium channel